MNKFFGAQRKVMHAISDLPGGDDGYVKDEQIAQRTGIDVASVGDWLETLAEEGYVEIAHLATGKSVYLTSKGSLAIRPSSRSRTPGSSRLMWMCATTFAMIALAVAIMQYLAIATSSYPQRSIRLRESVSPITKHIDKSKNFAQVHGETTDSWGGDPDETARILPFTASTRPDDAIASISPETQKASVNEARASDQGVKNIESSEDHIDQPLRNRVNPLSNPSSEESHQPKSLVADHRTRDHVGSAPPRTPAGYKRVIQNGNIGGTNKTKIHSDPQRVNNKYFVDQSDNVGGENSVDISD